MKTFAYLMILFLFSTKLLAQEFKESELPPTVVSSFKDKFTPEGKASWFKDLGIFTASFKSDGQNVKASFTSEGKWTDTKYEIVYKELPGPVVTYITTNFKDSKIKESSLRETESESDHYYVVLKKDGITSTAELFFDMKGILQKENVPDDFLKSTSTGQAVIKTPPVVYTAFKTKYPDAAITTWKSDSATYTAYFKSEEMTGRAEFAADGTWQITKYSISEKELPGPIISEIKANYLGYKVKTTEMVEEPATTDYYYLFVKKDGIGQPSAELYFTLTGKLIKKVASAEKGLEEATNDTTTTSSSTTISASTTQEQETEIEYGTTVIAIKELPSTILTYVKKNYYGYSIKETVLSTTEEGTFYYVKIKKEGKKQLTELSFDASGKYLEEKVDTAE